MARGFGSTLGAGSTDRIEVATASAVFTSTTWAFRVYQHGTGGADTGRVWLTTWSSDTKQSTLVHVNTGPVLQLNVQWSGSLAKWTIPRPSLDAWHVHVITYDASSTSNDPAWTVDGSAQTVTETAAPSGTVDTTSSPHYIGNNQNGAQNRVWDGMIADFAIYDRLWSPGEIAAYMAGYSSLFFPGARVQADLIRAADSRINGPASVTGTAVQPHPRIIMPSRRRVGIHVAAGGGGAPGAAYYYYLT